MYERLRRLYRAGRIGEEELDKAVANGWITEEQKNLIISENKEEHDQSVALKSNSTSN